MKNLDLTLANLCNNENNNKKKFPKRKLLKYGLCGLGIAGWFVALGIVGTNELQTIKANDTTAATEAETEQKYIVRYGVAYDYGTTIITSDGNEWTLEDAPEYEDGTEVRVLFDSCETSDVTDDVIIDVTETVCGYIKLEDCIPLEDIACYFIDGYDYPCFELKDVGNQLDNPYNKSYAEIMDSLENVTEEYKTKGIIK